MANEDHGTEVCGAGLTRRRLIEQGLAASVAISAGSLAVPNALAAGRARLAAPKPRYGRKIRVGLFAQGSQLDPARFFDAGDNWRVNNVFDFLAKLHPGASGRVRWDPWLAESVKPLNAKGTKYRVTLERGVKFHNGAPLSADDVVFSWARQLDATQGFPQHDALTAYFDQNSFVKVDGRTVDFDFKAPQTQEQVLGLFGAFSAVVPHGTTDFSQPIGTGPFTFVSSTENRQSVVGRNPGYWVKGRPYLDGATGLFFQDETAKHNALLGGQIDVEARIDATNLRSVLKDQRFTILRSPSDAGRAFTMRTDVKPFNDPRVRLAFKLAVDREQMVKNVWLGSGRVGNDLWGPHSWYYNKSLPQLHYDPERARSLLREAGYKNGIHVTLDVPNNEPVAVLSAQVFKEQAKKAGITINVTLDADANTYYTKLSNGAIPFGSTNWGSDLDYVYNLAVNGSYDETGWNGGTQHAWYHSFFVARGLPQGSRKAKSIWWALQKKLLYEGGYIVWGFSDLLDVASKRVHGIIPTNWGINLGNYYMTDWWLS